MASSKPQDAIAPTDEPLQESRNNRQDSTGSVAKIVHNAKAATDKEQQMTLLQGIKLYPKAVAWSVLISTCIVMEGYDISLVNNFYAFPQFAEKYGELTSKGTYEVPARVWFFFFSFLTPLPSHGKDHCMYTDKLFAVASRSE
jgi:SP family general alpha glucoside:H+ symporter-like MFS transporter